MTLFLLETFTSLLNPTGFNLGFDLSVLPLLSGLTFRSYPFRIKQALRFWFPDCSQPLGAFNYIYTKNLSGCQVKFFIRRKIFILRN